MKSSLLIAVIADIHGNSLALDAVLREVAEEKPDLLLNLGDAFNGPVDPAGVASSLKAIDAIHVSGNGDRMVAARDGAAISQSARFARERLDAGTIEWAGRWPLCWRQDDIAAFHGSPDCDATYLLEGVERHGVRLRSAAEIERDLAGGPDARLMFCGHTHIPRLVTLPRGRTIVNPGSVGLPAYDDETPFPHKMETGSPHARYAVVRITGTQVQVESRAVEYDWQTAAEMAAGHGFPAWASALRTGYV